MCIYIIEIWFEIANWQILSISDRFRFPLQNNGVLLSFCFYLQFILYCSFIIELVELDMQKEIVEK